MSWLQVSTTEHHLENEITVRSSSWIPEYKFVAEVVYDAETQTATIRRNVVSNVALS